MLTFTQVDGAAFPGTLIIGEPRIHSSLKPGRFNYLSADLGELGWLSVSNWDFDDCLTSEDELRSALAATIRIKLDS